MADSLNGGGYSLQQVVTLPITCTTENVKANIAHRFMVALFPDKIKRDGTVSTADLSTTEIKILFECMNNAMAEKFGVSHTWPDRYNGGEC